ncbi:efflux RND transporter permease subunit [bacterium]|nr:efflux RND transporter permease subunit [bacterium]
MNLPSFSVSKPVTITMMIGIIVVVGIIAYSQIGLELIPDLGYPIISVLTFYEGASPMEIEEFVTKLIEENISTVSRVKKVTSLSQEGVSAVMVEFEWGTNLDFAAQDIRDRISLFKDYLPEEISEPIVLKFDFSMMPINVYAVKGYEDTGKLRELINDVVKDRLERLDGVAQATVIGGKLRIIEIELDKAKIENLKLNPNTIIQAIRFNNLNMPAGYIVQRHTEYLVRSIGEYESLEEIGNTIIGATEKGIPIYLKNIAEIKDTHPDIRDRVRIQGEDCIFLMVSKESGANTVSVANKVSKEIENIKKVLPKEIVIENLFDQAEFINFVTKKTGSNAIMGAVLAILVILFFLKNLRPTFAIAVAIPLSIIATFIPIYFAGYTFNLITLVGLALGVGMLVDNSIVVIENIFRHLSIEGIDRYTAAKRGASEVGMAIAASTFTTISVFLPVIFFKGIISRLAKGLALTVSFSLLASLFVALTLVPMIASIIFKKRQYGYKRFTWFNKLQSAYTQSLKKVIKARWLVLSFTVVLLGVSIFLLFVVGGEFMPEFDASMMQGFIKLPPGTEISETDHIISQIEKKMLKHPAVLLAGINIGVSEASQYDVAFGQASPGVSEGNFFVRLVDKKDRNISSSELTEYVRSSMPPIKGAKIIIQDMSGAMMGGEMEQAPIDIKIYGNDLNTLKEIGSIVVNNVKEIDGVADVELSLQEGKPEIQIKIDREKAAFYGLTVGEIASTIQTYTIGTNAGRFKDAKSEVDIKVRLSESDRNSFSDLANLPIYNRLGKTVPLNLVADLKYGEGPIKITRENQSRKVSVTMNVVGRDLRSTTRDVNKLVNKLKDQGVFPTGYSYEIGGEYKLMVDTFVTLFFAFLLALLLVYMVMASQFESFIHPFVIMFTIPLSIIGVSFMLFITGKTLCLPSGLGILVLAGIAVNNGIVLIDYINKLRKDGLNKLNAVIEAGRVRLRPILMTATTTILGMVPLALSRSEGSEFRSALAVSIIGGLITATFLTLYIIPIVYLLLEGLAVNIKTSINRLLHGEE